MRIISSLAAFITAFAIVVVACGGSDSGGSSSSNDAGPRGVELTGQECTAATQCYAGLDAGSLSGAAQCLTNVPNGYCTHLCTQDSDCCAAPGECKTSLKQVCSPFESTGQMMCFLSCEDGDIPTSFGTGALDGGTRDDDYCHAYASTAFGCRSTGGGSKNRKVCLP